MIHKFKLFLRLKIFFFFSWVSHHLLQVHYQNLISIIWVHTVNHQRTMQVQTKVITIMWIPYRIQLTLVLVVQTNLFVQYFLWKIRKCNHLGHRRKPKEVLKWVCIMQQVTDLKILCRFILGNQRLGCMYHKLILQGSGYTNWNII